MHSNSDEEKYEQNKNKTKKEEEKVHSGPTRLTQTGIETTAREREKQISPIHVSYFISYFIIHSDHFIQSFIASASYVDGDEMKADEPKCVRRRLTVTVATIALVLATWQAMIPTGKSQQQRASSRISPHVIK